MTGTSPCRLFWLELGATLRWDLPALLLTPLGYGGREGFPRLTGHAEVTLRGTLWVHASLPPVLSI